MVMMTKMKNNITSIVVLAKLVHLLLQLRRTKAVLFDIIYTAMLTLKCLHNFAIL